MDSKPYKLYYHIGKLSDSKTRQDKTGSRGEMVISDDGCTVSAMWHFNFFYCTSVDGCSFCLEWLQSDWLVYCLPYGHNSISNNFNFRRAHGPRSRYSTKVVPVLRLPSLRYLRLPYLPAFATAQSQPHKNKTHGKRVPYSTDPCFHMSWLLTQKISLHKDNNSTISPLIQLHTIYWFPFSPKLRNVN